MKKNREKSVYVKEIADMAKKLGSTVAVLTDELLMNPKFDFWSACSCSDGHHYGTGGLAQHTYEVIRLSMDNGERSQLFGNGKTKFDVLFLAALYHDVGKMWDYSYSSNPQVTPSETWHGIHHKRIVHHISRSAVEWSKAVEKTGVGRELEEEVLHCILSHHGNRAAGSPVAPYTREAWILHLSDGLSARMNDCYRLDQLTLRR
jgi:3'-5' exoribonuclease